jgi:diguanylate cyclase (GGDEF)-like protein
MVRAWQQELVGHEGGLMKAKAQEVISSCKRLPTIPAIALEVLRLSHDDNVDLRQIAGVISRDVALSTRILSVVNSAFYGLPRKVSTVSQAVVVLGLASVKTLALGFSLAEGISRQKAGAGPLEYYWRRSLYMAVAARTFAERKVPILREEAFTAGLLADVGVLAMGEACHEAYAPFRFGEKLNHVGLIDQERERFGTDHQEVGRCLADTWQLPELLTVPMACHHYPEACGDVDPMVVDLVRIVYAANLCAEAFCGDRSRQVVDNFEQAAQQYLGLERAACRETVEHLNTDAQDVAQILEINIPESTGYAQIVQDASEALTQLTLQSQQQVLKVEQEQRKATNRLQELEEANRLLAQNANLDPLAGVYNRRFVEGFLEREIARSSRFKRPLSILFIDVDHFKEINDQHGHPAGDAVLQQIAQLMKANTRESDCLCRYGGEEFVLALVETDLLGAQHVAEKIRRMAAGWKFKCPGVEQEFHVTVSIGIATTNPNRPMTKEVLIQMADESTYAAKREGRNCVCALRKRVTPLAQSAATSPAE